MRFARYAPAALLIVLSSCAREISRPLAPNQPPEVRLTVEAVPAAEDATDYAMTWSARDPDGRVDRFLVSVDARSRAPQAPGWITTRATRHVARIARPAPSSPGVAAADPGYHVFAVRAVDDQGAVSSAATAAFFGDNAAPTVTLLDPAPSLERQTLPPTFQVRWAGEDPDGRVVEYRYRLFGTTNPDFPEIEDFVAFVLENPDTLARLYGPTFESWTAAGAGAIQTTFKDLKSSQEFVLAITAIDDEGAFDPVFTTDRNLLHFRVGTFEVGSPTFTLNGVTMVPGIEPDPESWVDYEIPADVLVRLNLSVTSAPGVPVKVLRWRLELPEGPKQDEVDVPQTTIEVGPLRNDGEMFWLRLGATTRDLTYEQLVRLIVVRPTFDAPLLIVDDTRFAPDQFVNGNLLAPRGRWPSAAELDTFLFAIGGVPWRGYPPTDDGPLTTPGLFHGYDFDTIGTRALTAGTMPLSVLTRYRNVVWCTDAIGANFVGSPFDPRAPITMLRYMNAPGRVNTLAQYVAMGGRLWLMGGGAAAATLIEWNNEDTPSDEFSAADGELVPGRFVYDWVRWRSRVATSRSAIAAALHLAGVLTPFEDPGTAPGRGWPGQPDYSTLPASLNLRTPKSDPLPPRVTESNFYVTDFNAEVLIEPNAILEDQASTLDTLYLANGPGLALRPMMTLHHGADGNPALFSGFGVWDLQRAQAIPVVDFVLQRLWGLQRADLPRRPSRARAVAGRAQRRE